jgi:hypothetical protein
MKPPLAIFFLLLNIIASAQLREGTYFTDSVTHIDIEDWSRETLIERSEYGFENDTLYSEGHAIYILNRIEQDQYKITPLIRPENTGEMKVKQKNNQYIIELSFHDQSGILYLKYHSDQVRKVHIYSVGISEIE